MGLQAKKWAIAYVTCVALAVHALATGHPDWVPSYIAAMLVMAALRRRNEGEASK